MTIESEDVKRIVEKITEAELKEITKAGIKEAASEFLKEKFAEFGKWSLFGLGAIFVVALLYFAAWLSGWRPH